eukprot:gene5384-9191_t
MIDQFQYENSSMYPESKGAKNEETESSKDVEDIFEEMTEMVEFASSPIVEIGVFVSTYFVVLTIILNCF